MEGVNGAQQFISLKKAAAIFGYAPDYLGFLIREGKIVGRRVYTHKEWRVSLAPLLGYKEKKSKKNDKGTRSGLRKIFNKFKNKKYVTLKEAAEVSGYHFNYIGYLIRKGRVPGKKIYCGVTWLTTKESVRNYLREREERQNQFLIKPFSLLLRKGFYFYFKIPKRIVALAVLVIMIFGGFNFWAAASKNQFELIDIFPIRIEGNWSGIENIQGPPQVGEDGDINYFNEKNSASYQSGALSILVQNFQETGIVSPSFFKEGQATTTQELNTTTSSEIIPEENKTSNEPATDSSLELENKTSTEDNLEIKTSTEPATSQEISEIKTSTTDVLENKTSTATSLEVETSDKGQETSPSTGSEQDPSTNSGQEETTTPEVISFLGSAGNMFWELAQKTVQFFQTKIAQAQQVPTFEELTKEKQLISAKIKFSFAIGERNPDLKLLPEDNATPSENGTASRLWQNLKKLFSEFTDRLGLVTKAQEGEIVPAEPPATTQTLNEETGTNNGGEILSLPTEIEETPVVDAPGDTAGQASEATGTEAELRDEEINQNEEIEQNKIIEESIGVGGATSVQEAETTTENISISSQETVTTTEEVVTATETATITDETLITTPEATATEADIEKLLLNPDARVIIWWSVDGENWQTLDTISSDNLSNVLNGGYFTYDAPFLKDWKDVKNLKLKFQGFERVDGRGIVVVGYLDSVWVEAGYQDKEKKEEEFELRPVKNDWQANEEPTFELVKIRKQKPNEELLAALGAILGAENQPALEMATGTEPIIEANLFDPGSPKGLGKLFKGEEIIKDVARNDFEERRKIIIPKESFSRSGRYNFTVSVEQGGVIYNLDQDFTWGVLAINVNKSIYLPGEQSYLQMAVLDDAGHTICDADLTLEIISPEGVVTTLSTLNTTNSNTNNHEDVSGASSSISDPSRIARIERSTECGPSSVTYAPDYYAYYQVAGVGVYQIKLIALTKNGIREITDQFEVRDSVPFEVERIGPTRIYPPATYQTIFIIKANEDFKGQVIEQVPTSFDVTSNESTQIRTQNDTKEVVWNVDWKAGENHVLDYEFLAPWVSPYLYLLGPLEFTQNPTDENANQRKSDFSIDLCDKTNDLCKSVFTEARRWQLAADSVTTTYDFVTCTDRNKCFAEDEGVNAFTVSAGPGSKDISDASAEPDAAGYTAIGTDDTNEFTTVDPGGGDESVIEAYFQINEPTSSISALGLQFIGRNGTANTITFRIWNFTTGRWITLGTVVGVNTTTVNVVTTTIGAYIGSGTSQTGKSFTNSVVLSVDNALSSQSHYVDYFKVDVGLTTITVSGYAYDNEGTTAWSGCNGGNIAIHSSGAVATTTCSAATGYFTNSNVIKSATGTPIIVWFNNTSTYGSAVTRYAGSGNVTTTVRKNSVSVSHQDSGPITVSDVATYDSDNDSDINYYVNSEWKIATTTGATLIYSLTLDSANNVVYAGGGSGTIYSCDTPSGCGSSDWSLATDTGATLIYSLTFDSANSVVYAGDDGGTIYSCQASSGCGPSDWSIATDTGAAQIRSLTFDSANNVVYAGDSTGTIYSCQASSGCGPSDWSIATDTGAAWIRSLTFDSANNVVYAGNSTRTIYSCQTSSGCGPSDWSIATEIGAAQIPSLTFDSANNVVYAGDSSGIIYRFNNGSLVIEAGSKLRIDATSTFTPGETVNIAQNPNGDLYVSAGSTLDGTSSILVYGGDATGTGTINLTGGTFLLDGTSTGYFGSNASWVFYNLDFGSGYATGTSQATSTGTTTISGVLTITPTQTLNAGQKTWILSGSGTPFQPNGTFTSASSTFKYNATSNVNVVAQNYYNLEMGPADASSSDWTLATDTPSTIWALTFDSANNVVYAGDSSGRIYRCQTSSGCGTADWTLATDTGAAIILALTFDSANNVVYAGDSTGTIYRCQTASGCGTTDWTLATDTPLTTWALTFDSANNVVYAGNSSGIIYRCQTSSGCGTADWTLATDMPSAILSLTFDSANNAVYAGDGGGVIYRCQTSSGCGTADWTLATDTPSAILSLTFDSANNAVYAGDNTGIIYRCQTSSGCGTTDWTLATDTGAAIIQALTFDSANNVVYAGDSNAGVIYRHFSGYAYDLGAAAGQTFDVGGYCSADKANIKGDTYNATLDFNGNLTISSQAEFYAPTSSSFTIAGNWANSGTFNHSNATVTFDGSNTSTLSGTTTFYNLTCETPSKTLQFSTTSATTTVSGNFYINGGACGTKIKLRSTNPGSYWYLNSMGTNDITYADIQDSNASGSAAIIEASYSTDSNHNANWSISDDCNAAGIDISGTVYTNEGTTTSIAAGLIVALAKNGTKTNTSTVSTTDGSYSFTNITAASGTVLTIFIDDSTSTKGVVVTKSSGASTTGINIYKDRIIIRNEITGPITIQNLDKYDSEQDGDILFTASSTAGTLNASSSSELFVWSGDTFLTSTGTAGTTSLSDLDIRGTFTATGSQAINLTCYATFTQASCWYESGTFNSASSTVTFTTTSTGKSITTGGSPFYNLVFNGSGGAWNFQDAATTTNDLTISAGTASSSNNMYVYGGDATGTGTLTWTGGTFLLDGNGNFGGSATWTFYNLTFGNGTGNETTTATSTGTTTISNLLTIAASQNLNAGSKTWNIGGYSTTSSPFVIAGSFTAASSTFRYTTDQNTKITATIYYNLELVDPPPEDEGEKIMAAEEEIEPKNIIFEQLFKPFTGYDLTQSDVSLDKLIQKYQQSAEIKSKYQIGQTRLIMPAKSKNDIRVEIGEEGSNDFTPTLKLDKWQGETSFKIKPNLEGVEPKDLTLTFEGNKIKLAAPKKEFHFYDIPPNNEHPEGAYEYEVILKEKPATNTLTFDIETSNLDFFYQPPLNQENHPFADYCTETECFKDGRVVTRRPENVVGSYAVYYKDGVSGDYSQLGGKNYGTGKAFHIYRPKITDALGNWVWEDLKIDTEKGKMTITVPQEFLENAAYPLVNDPTLGYTTSGAAEDNLSANYAAATTKSTSTENGTVSKVTIRGYASGVGSGLLKMGYYTDSSGLPNSRVAHDDTGIIPTTTLAWIDSNAISGSITSSNAYWPAFLWTEGSNLLYFRYDNLTTGLYWEGGAYTSLPATYPSPDGSNNYKVSIYLTYTATGGGPSAGPTYTLATTTGQNLVVNNNLLIGNGVDPITVTATTNNPIIDVGGNVAISASSTLVAPTSSLFSVAGNWSKAGSFTHSNGTVAFDGNSTSTFSGTTTFYNLTSTSSSKVLQFASGTAATTTVSGTLTLNGQACGTPIYLRSTANGTQFYINAAAASINYVNVKDSYAVTALTASSSVNSGNNTNWAINGGSCAMTISGTVYTNEGTATSASGSVVSLAVNGAWTASTTASTSTGAYSLPSVTSTTNTITVYLDDSAEKGVVVTIASSSDISDLNIYKNRIIVRHENTGPITIQHLDKYDSTNDGDILFTASSTAGTLDASSSSELFVWSGDTFLTSTGTAGTISLSDLDIRGTFTATGSQAINLTCYATFTQASCWYESGTFNSASSTVTFTTTSTGKSITTGGSPFWNLVFNGSGGGWTFQDAATTTNDLTVTAGTVSSAYNMYVYGGDATSSSTGVLSWTGGTFLLGSGGYFRNNSTWTFYNLTFGSGSVTTTYATGTGTTTVSNVLTIAVSQTLNAGSKTWNIAGYSTTSSPFVVSGSFSAASSTFRYTTSQNTNITAAAYYNLELVDPPPLSEGEETTEVKEVESENLVLQSFFRPFSGYTLDTSDVSLDKLIEKYQQSAEIKSKYQIGQTKLVIPAKDKNDISLEIGEEGTDDFVPTLKLDKWQGETSFKIKPDLEGVALKDRTLTFEGNKIKFGTPEKEFRFYDISPNQEHPSGAYEYEVILKEKPVTNTLTFDIETSNLDFFYQPPLNQQRHFNVDYCTETECFKDGRIVIQMPDNVLGSYAVYYKDGVSGDYSQLGGKNYGTGKAFHIYRPKITDALGNWVWEELRIDKDKGKMIITIPQEFLDGAIYPLINDPTLGYTSIGSLQDFCVAEYVCAGLRTLATSTGTSTKITIYSSSTGSMYVQMGYYTDSSNYPGTLVASSTTNVTSSTPSWKDSNTISGVITSGNYYWLAQLVTTTEEIFYYRYDTGSTIYYQNTYTSLPATYPASAPSTDQKVSMYLTYTTTGGPSVGPTYTLATTTSQTLVVNNNLLIGNGVDPITVTATTNNPIIDVGGNVTISASSTLVAPTSSSFTIAGNWSNSGSFIHSTSTVTFDAPTTGKTIVTNGTSSGKTFYNIDLNSASGGWTIQTNNLKAENNFSLSNANSFTASSGVTVEVNGNFTNLVGGASTTWSTSTLYLNKTGGGSYTINTKSTGSDSYGTLLIGANTDIRMWDSSAATSSVDNSGSLYSMDNAGIAGELYIWGDYHATSTDYWEYTKDFDGQSLGTNRQCKVYIQPNTAVTVDSGATTSIKGGGAASSDITLVTSTASWNFYNKSGSELTFQEATITNAQFSSGTVTVLNTTLNNETVTSTAVLNVDWYLGVLVVDRDVATHTIDTLATDITISENSTSASSTIWKWSSGSWGTASTSQQTGSTASGTIPYPGQDGAIRIREYKKTSATTSYYKYNLAITSQAGSLPYNYYTDQGSAYLTSTSSPLTLNVDKVIWEGWQRNSTSTMNPTSTVNDPPTNGSWYIGMNSDLEFSVSSSTVNLGYLNLANNLTATGSTILYATTSYAGGYLIKAYASDDGQLRLGTTSNYIIRWSSSNATPTSWTGNCYQNGQCGFGYTTSDNKLAGGTNNRFATSTNYAGFATSSPGDLVGDSTTTASGATTTITYRVSVPDNQTIGEYTGSVYFICTVNY